jgi:MYXO-CTERM domain-containing protein
MRNLLVVAAVIGFAAGDAHAFCGFYVSPGGEPMFNDATQVVLMRKGTRTVLSMQNNYKGPIEAFAMVIPVPVVLHEGDVKILPKEVFANVERMGAPRLVEYWEQDPCAPEDEYDDKPMKKMGAAPMRHLAKASSADLGVTIEAQFEVGEYQIVILSAKDSTGLDTWLRQESYNVPKGAEPLLRPYVEGGSKFFVAKVDPKKVQFVDGRAALSPLRFHYDTDHFTLPIRLGLANSSGTQDLIVNILAPNQRYEVANYDNVTIPTNLDVKDSVKDRFGAFYAALYDRTVEKHPGAVVTEYAWQATTCDPCPGPALNYHDFIMLGADVIDGDTNQIATPPQGKGAPIIGSAAGAPAPPPPRPMRRMSRGYGMDFVLTRLHARYGKDITDDLVFREAEPIVGGREHVIDPQTGKLEEGAQKDSTNNFQGRYAIRHEWTGAIACANPHRHVWGGPPGGGRVGISPALGLAFAPRGQVQLASAFVPTDVPEIGLHNGVLDTIPKPPPKPGAIAATTPERGKDGCGCATNDPAGLAGMVALVGLGILRPARRRRRQNRT